jgi:hypothetical protein
MKPRGAFAMAIASVLVTFSDGSSETVQANTPPPAASFGTTITSQNNRVYQQNASGVAPLSITWRGVSPDMIRLRNAATGAVVSESSSGQFGNVAAGWYRAIAVKDGVEGDEIRTGVGGVLLVAGQSDAVAPLQPPTFPYQKPQQQGRVIVSDYYGQGSNVFVDTFDTPVTSSICWIKAALDLNRPYPIMVVNVAQGNTSTADWVNTLITRIFVGWATYSPKTIAWQQGVSDAALGFTQSQTFVNMNAMVESLRAVTVTPWVIAISSRFPASAATRAAQNQVIAAWPHVYAGPDIDAIRDAANPDELYGEKLTTQGQVWSPFLAARGL